MFGRPDRSLYSGFLFLLNKLEIGFFGSGLMREDRQNLESLDAVRGIGSFVVMWHHLVLGFQPNWKFDPLLATSPWIRVWYHGDFAVHVFFVLSGFVLSYSFVKSGNMDVLRAAAVKRYWRLFLPVAVSILISYLLFTAGAYANRNAARFMHQEVSSWLNQWFAFPLSWIGAIDEAVYGAFFRYDVTQTYNSSLWTMQTEFLGSFFIFAFQGLARGLRCRPLIFLLLFAVFLRQQQLWMIDFLAGAAICDLFHSQRLWIPSPIGLGLAVFGVLLAGTSPAWLFATIGDPLIPGWMSNYIPMVSALLVILGVLWSPFLQRQLSTGPLLLLGRMSFPLYLIHLLVECSLGCRVYLWVVRDAGFSHNSGFIAASLATIAVSLGLAWIGSFTVEPQSIALGRWVYARWFQPLKSADKDLHLTKPTEN